MTIYGATRIAIYITQTVIYLFFKNYFIEMHIKINLNKIKITWIQHNLICIF